MYDLMHTVIHAGKSLQPSTSTDIDHFAVFSSLRVYAVSGRSLATALLVGLLSMISFGTEIVCTLLVYLRIAALIVILGCKSSTMLLSVVT